jgi:sugar phosphate isomerase/epimerase
VTVPYIDQRLRKTADDFKALTNWINIGSQRVQAAGLKMGYHNHNFEFEEVGGEMLMDVLLKNTNSDLVDFEMDIYWVVRAGQDPLQWLDYYPGRFKLIHVKDMDKNDKDLNTEIGNGSIDYKQLLPAINQIGVKYFIVEQENYKIDPYVSIAQSNKYLRDVLS